MTAICFGTGWRDRLGRQRTLMWLSDTGWVLFDNGRDVEIVRRNVHDEVGLRCRLLGWEDHCDEPGGYDWAVTRVCYWAPSIPDPDCCVCQGEGWVAGSEGIAVRCACDAAF